MYYSYDYSTVPHPPQYWVKPCWECGEDYHPDQPHDPSEPLRFHALAEAEDDLTQQDFLNSAFPCHAQSEISIDGLLAMLLILAILMQLGDGLLLSL